ncbi:MAG TPA: efflux RND transporter periplasmic adaptor subunit [Polyangiaceae bacterium]|jgi:HlyD family secretion protein|nr:efflux RND transporter periplasmic adaptor subunit [Polyangiaceae bacterium]
MTIGVETSPPAQRRSAPDEARKALERELKNRGSRRWLVRVAILVAVGLLGWGGRVYYQHRKPPPPPRFSTRKVEKRDIFEEVQSTGKVKPLKEVQVGAQVSGRVVNVSVDFNSPVKKGDVLAEIDPRLFGAQVSQTRAQIEQARAAVKRAEATLLVDETLLARVQRLQKESLSSQSDLDQAEGNRNVAKADVASADANLVELQAQLASASTTLQYTRITSPIDGIVITRSIDPGQTVASSFTAPVLFVIAPNLQQMQVLADIDEADVGKVHDDMPATIVVDAFPGDVFRGKVIQVRYSPNEVLGVVTYSAIIDVANPDLKLRPGMTATVTVQTRRAEGVPAIPNAALRFRPINADAPPAGAAAAPPAAFGTELKPGQGRVYLPSQGGNEAVEKIVPIGITDGRFTEAKSELTVGADVVTEQRDAKRPDKFLGLF